MWNPEHAITEADAIVAAKNDTLEALRIVKDQQDFYVLLRLSWRKEERECSSIDRYAEQKIN
jgi:hypothetical protein